jgi:hypothetical protein
MRNRILSKAVPALEFYSFCNSQNCVLLVPQSLGFDSDRIRVLGTSARKSPLSDTLLWATLSLAHPFKIEVILSKRVDVLPKQRGCEAQNIVVDHLALSAEFRVFSFCG